MHVDVDNYLSDRDRDLTWSYLHGFERDPEGTLESVLNAPHRIGRKTIDALVSVGCLPPDTLADMHKSTIAQAVSAIYGMRDERIDELQDSLRADFDRYLEFAAEVKAGKFSRDEHDQVLHAALTHSLPLAIEFIRRIQTQYRQYFSQAE